MRKNDIKAKIYFLNRRRAMHRKTSAIHKIMRDILYCVLLCIFLVLGIDAITSQSRYGRLRTSVLESEGYRRQRMDTRMLDYICEAAAPGRELEIGRAHV